MSFIRELLSRFGMKDEKSLSTPIDINIKLVKSKKHDINHYLY